MANDLTLPVRRAILTALKGNGALTAIVPASSIYPQSTPANPAWPFIKYGAPSGIPINAACVDGHEIIVAVHGFAKQRSSGGAVVETAEDHASRIGAFIAAALDRARLDLDGGTKAKVRWTSTNGPMQDGAEADAYHVVVNFRMRCLA